MMPPLLLLAPDDDITPFPPAEDALEDPNGLLAIGGPLSPRRLVMAYRNGIFPWFSEGQPVLWWSPDPRAVFLPKQVHVGRSLRKRLRNAGLEVAFDRCFEEVMRACAAPRTGQPGTWITPEMISAYVRLYELGLAHSVEVYQAGRLVGGLYGVAIGKAFFGESMFSARPDASKVALVWLANQLWEWGFQLIDCQMPSAHLARLGAKEIPGPRFLSLLAHAVDLPPQPGPWHFDNDFDPLAPLAEASI